MRKRTRKAAKTVRRVRAAKAEKTERVVKKRFPRYQCMRCEKIFPSRNALKIHSKAHLRAIKEMRLLEEGHVPEETKLGSEFKGKNRIIVS